MSKRKPFRIVRYIVSRLLVVAGAAGITLLLFLVLPLMQTLTKPPTTDLTVQSIDTAKLDAPDPPPEPEPIKEPEPDPEPPELTEEAPLMDLTQLELAMNPGVGDGWMGGDFAVKLDTVVTKSKDVEELFSIADLDQKPRVIYQPGPVISKDLRAKAPGTVHVLFVVNQQGRVEDPRVHSSTDPVFDKAALHAVKQWKFEPGKRSGQPVRFRMRVPITFPKGL
jgi:protein TonB